MTIDSDELKLYVHYIIIENKKNSPNNGHSPFMQDALSGKYKLLHYGENVITVYIEQDNLTIPIITFIKYDFNIWLRNNKLDSLI